MQAFFYFMRSILLFIAILLPRLASGYKVSVAIRAGELVVQMALTFNYILQQGLMSVRETGLITSKQ
jgi:hypothetical protein